MSGKDSRQRYRYKMHVVETIEYTTEIDSDVKLDPDELDAITEQRRVIGGLTFCGVTDVDAWCSSFRDLKTGKRRRYARRP